MSSVLTMQGWVTCDEAFIAEDIIRFEESVWRRGQRVGKRLHVARVLELAGDDPEDWVVLEVIHSQGDFPEEPGQVFRRRRRNVTRSGVDRRLWEDESAREIVAAA